MKFKISWSIIMSKNKRYNQKYKFNKLKHLTKVQSLINFEVKISKKIVLNYFNYW